MSLSYHARLGGLSMPVGRIETGEPFADAVFPPGVKPIAVRSV